ncbi:MAG: peptidoglycan-binding protein [Bauldia sp.]|nr:peptidoglycan-binding protein [Bauldia sp.]
MKTSPKGIAFIAAAEGVVTRAYRDVGGVWTIGVGHTAAAGPPRPAAGMTITREEAHAILARDLPCYEQRVTAALGDVPQTVFDGAVSFDFNTGAIHRASWVKAYQAGNHTAARQSLMRWTRAGGQTVAGLVRRRHAEARLIFEGAYGTAGASRAASPAVAAYQKMLATLGFYHGALDGIAGPMTRAAVLAYQRRHPDLVADGIAGPATLASLARDLAARESGLATVTGAAATALVAAAAAPADGLVWAAIAAAIALGLGLGFLALRYGGEVRRMLTLRKGH